MTLKTVFRTDRAHLDAFDLTKPIDRAAAVLYATRAGYPFPLNADGSDVVEHRASIEAWCADGLIVPPRVTGPDLGTLRANFERDASRPPSAPYVDGTVIEALERTPRRDWHGEVMADLRAHELAKADAHFGVSRNPAPAGPDFAKLIADANRSAAEMLPAGLPKP